MKRHFRDSGWAVRPPRSMQETRAAVMEASAELTQTLGRSPRTDEVAQFLGTDVEQVIEALAVGDCYTPMSLDKPASIEGPETLGDLLGAEDRELSRTEARLVLAPLVRSLKERDREILELRFFHGLTQQEIGDQIGVSQMQVSRLLGRILAQLRRGLGEDASPAGEQPIEASPLPWAETAG